jgi:hypothetical protein
MIIFLNGINWLILVVVTGCVSFEVKTECLNIIKMVFSFKELISSWVMNCVSWLKSQTFRGNMIP